MRQGAHRTRMGWSAEILGRGSDQFPVDAQPELLAHLEKRHALGRYANDAAGAGIAPLASLPLLDDEAAEAANLDAAAAAQGVRHAAEHRVDDDLSVAAGIPRIASHQLFDQVAFGHGRALLPLVLGCALFRTAPFAVFAIQP